MLSSVLGVLLLHMVESRVPFFLFIWGGITRLTATYISENEKDS